MSYQSHLKRWAIARLLPDEEWTVVARFRSWSDAEGHLRQLNAAKPHSTFKLVFDIPKEDTEDNSSMCQVV